MAENRPIKRRKTLLACEYCRNKKTKCDGQRPVCGSCAKRGWGPNRCIWRHVDGKEDFVPLTRVQDLERRIQELERQGNTSNVQQDALASVSAYSTYADSPDVPDPSPSNISAIEGAVTGEQQTEGFVGPAAAAAFMDTVRRAVDPQHTTRRVVPGPKLPIRQTSLDTPIHVLPVRQDADIIVRLYWIYVHPIYPFLFEPTFESIYENLWSRLPTPSAKCPMMQTTYVDNICLVNLVLSLGCQYAAKSDVHHGSHHGSRQAAVYFERARRAFQYDPFEEKGPSLERVQVLLLMVQYLKSVGNTQRAWEIIGIAIRMSQRLGLHIRETSTEEVLSDLADREMVKRVWHGCVMVERMLSATLGRPAMIPVADPLSLPYPSELEEEPLLSTNSDATYTSGMSVITFFVLSIKLFEIVQRILSSLYVGGLEDSANDNSRYFTDTDSVLAFDNQMSRWFQSIPQYLRLDSDALSLHASHAADKFRRQAAVLKVRYLQARIYLFRPILSQICMMHHTATSDESDLSKIIGFTSSLQHRVAIQCSLLCITEAVDLIETMHDNHTTSETWGKKPSWLYGVLHVYLAATVLLAARLAPDVLLTEVSEAKIEVTWNHALAILRDFQADSVSAHRCVSALETLYRRLPVKSNHDRIDAGLTDNQDRDMANFGIRTPPIPHDSWFSESQEFSLDWVPSFDLSDPLDMSWFMASESFT